MPIARGVILNKVKDPSSAQIPTAAPGSLRPPIKGDHAYYSGKMKTTYFVLAALLFVFPSSAQTSEHDASPSHESASAATPGRPCSLNFAGSTVPDCIRVSATGKLIISAQYLSALAFDSHGLAAVISYDEGDMYVDRSGKVLITGVASMDNGADRFQCGLVRIIRKKKYGFANRKGQIVIPPTFDGEMYFKGGRAAVCNGCSSEMAAGGHILVGGMWYFINTRGKIVKRTTDRETLKAYR